MTLDQIKAHFERNRIRYYIGSIVGVAGITCLIMKGRIEALALRSACGLETADTLVTNRPFFSFLSGQNVVSIRNELGRPSHLVHDITTDLYYSSQNAVAKAIGASPSRVSNHLHGSLAHIAGHQLERVPISV